LASAGASVGSRRRHLTEDDVAARQHGRAEAWHVAGAGPARQATARARRDGDGGRHLFVDNPAFINDQAEEQHYLDVLADEATDDNARASTRMELARLYERRERFLDAAEQYERNIWDGVRTPATYARLAAAYRAVGRDDLADAALVQIRRTGGAARSTVDSPRDRVQHVAARGARAVVGSWRGLFASSAGEQPKRPLERVTSTRRAIRTAVQPAAGVAAARDTLQSTRRLAAPFLTGQAGQRTRVVSTVVLPIVIGILIVGILVYMSSRRTAPSPAPAPTPAPVATLAPTAVPTPAIPAALSQPPAPARLLVSNVGNDGLSLRKTPGGSDRIKVWKEGTELVDLGQTSEAGGKTWRQVRDPDSNVGWAVSDFLKDPTSRPDSGRAAPTAPPFVSGGLGQTRQEWEQAHGQPSRVSIFLEYESGRLIVGLSNENVWHLERIWVPRDAVSLDVARAEARAFLPSDASLIQTVERGDGRTVDVYSSASLAPRFSPMAWNGGKVGTFSIQYRHRSAEDRRVTSAMFRLGDVSF
jgi:hypothetical protein